MTKELKTRRQAVADAIKAQVRIHTQLRAKGFPLDQPRVRESLRSAKAAYVDVTDFPPLSRSIGLPYDDANSCWKRPADIFEQGDVIAVFQGGTTASGIRQGELGAPAPRRLAAPHPQPPPPPPPRPEEGPPAARAAGNCWFMCSLGACVEFPTLVHSLFVGKWKNVSGNLDAITRSRSRSCHAASLGGDPRDAHGRSNSRSRSRSASGVMIDEEGMYEVRRRTHTLASATALTPPRHPPRS